MNNEDESGTSCCYKPRKSCALNTIERRRREFDRLADLCRFPSVVRFTEKTLNKCWLITQHSTNLTEQFYSFHLKFNVSMSNPICFYFYFDHWREKSRIYSFCFTIGQTTEPMKTIHIVQERRRRTNEDERKIWCKKKTKRMSESSATSIDLNSLWVESKNSDGRVSRIRFSIDWKKEKCKFVRL